MKRQELIGKLETVAPALSNNDIIPICRSFWFTGDEVMAFDGYIAISVPFKTAFVGAVPGDTLLSLLKALSVPEVEIEQDGEAALVRGGKSRVKLAMQPAAHFNKMFTMPASPTTALPCKGKELIDAMSLCMKSVSKDTTIPDQLGLTALSSSEYVTFYSSNDSTLSRAEVGLNSRIKLPKRAVLHAKFCKQFVSLASPKDQPKVEFGENHVMFAAPGGVRLFGALVESDKPLSYDEIFDRYHPASYEDNMTPIASKFNNIIERACIVAKTEAKTVRTRITVKDGQAVFITKTPLHEIKDQMQVPNGHPSVSIEVNPKAIAEGLDGGAFDKMLMTNRCITLKNNTGYFLVAGNE